MDTARLKQASQLLEVTKEADMHYYWFGWGHMIWMTLAWLVGIGLLVALFWAILQAASGRSRERESPEAILKRRYAAGEIDTEEYNRRLAVLKDKNVA